MRRTSRMYVRAYWWGVRARSIGERALRKLVPSRMRFVHHSWPLMPEVCPCDIHLCEYLEARGIRERAIFHFGTGGHHLVGRRNHERGLGNHVLAVTASPREHDQYVRAVVRAPSLGSRYQVLFADIYELNTDLLPMFDVITLFHLCEFSDVGGPKRRLDDAGVLAALLTRAAPGARILFYSGSGGWRQAQPLVDAAVAAKKLTFEEDYRTLRVYRAPATPA